MDQRSRWDGEELNGAHSRSPSGEGRTHGVGGVDGCSRELRRHGVDGTYKAETAQSALEKAHALRRLIAHLVSAQFFVRTRRTDPEDGGTRHRLCDYSASLGHLTCI